MEIPSNAKLLKKVEHFKGSTGSGQIELEILENETNCPHFPSKKLKILKVIPGEQVFFSPPKAQVPRKSQNIKTGAHHYEKKNNANSKNFHLPNPTVKKSTIPFKGYFTFLLITY